MAAEQPPVLACGGHFIGRTTDHFEVPLIDLLTHEVIVELARAVWRITSADVLTNRVRSANVEGKSTALPEQEFDEAFHIFQIAVEVWMSLRKDLRFEPRKLFAVSPE